MGNLSSRFFGFTIASCLTLEWSIHLNYVLAQIGDMITKAVMYNHKNYKRRIEQ